MVASFRCLRAASILIKHFAALANVRLFADTYDMRGSTETLETKYSECFDDEIRLLTRRQELDASFTPDVLEGTLKALYQIDGDNWEGRSSVAQTQLDAQIDAAEKFLHDWRTRGTPIAAAEAAVSAKQVSPAKEDATA